MKAVEDSVDSKPAAHEKLRRQETYDPVRDQGSKWLAAWQILMPDTPLGRLRSAMFARGLLLAIGLLGLVVHALDRSAVTLDAGELALFGLLILVALLPTVREVTLPGGGGAKLDEFLGLTEEAKEKGDAARKSIQEGAGASLSLTGPVDELASSLAETTEVDLSGVEDLAVVVPREGLIALRAELRARLSPLYMHFIDGPVPGSDYELVRALVRAGVVGNDLAQAAYALFGATEKGARLRDVPVDAVTDLVDIAERILSDIQTSAAPALVFERHVREVLIRMAAPTSVRDRRDGLGAFAVGNVIVEAKYIRPGVPARVVIARTIRQLVEQLQSDTRGLVVVNDDADFDALKSGPIIVKRLGDVVPEDFR